MYPKVTLARRPRAVVLFSGGLDSLVTLEWALRQGFMCYPIWYYYNQSNYVEGQAAFKQYRWFRDRIAGEWLCDRRPRRLGPFKSVHIPGYGELASSAMTRAGSDEADLNDLDQITVPARNLVFLSIAGAYAIALGASFVCVGFQTDDNSQTAEGMPDTGRGFADDMQVMLREWAAQKRQDVKILTPLLRCRKSRVLEIGREWGLPVDKAWSCLRGKAIPCGNCRSCASDPRRLTSG